MGRRGLPVRCDDSVLCRHGSMILARTGELGLTERSDPDQPALALSSQQKLVAGMLVQERINIYLITHDLQPSRSMLATN